MSATECFWHGPETDQPGDYGSCLECCHIWRTEADWRADCIRLAGEMGCEVNYQLTACPLCAHDLFHPPWLTGVTSSATTVERGSALLPGNHGVIPGQSLKFETENLGLDGGDASGREVTG